MGAPPPRSLSDTVQHLLTLTAVAHANAGIDSPADEGECRDVPLRRWSNVDQHFVVGQTRERSEESDASASGGDHAPRAHAGNHRGKVTGSRQSAASGDLEQAADAVVMVSTSNIDGASGLGGGFVIDRRGFVATNYHVVESAVSAAVRFRDGTTAKVEGCLATDEARDPAILKVSKVPGHVRPLRETRQQRPALGSPVVAIGHPRGFRHTISRGTINAVRRTAELPASLRSELDSEVPTRWIQTDAVISNGSSGGPILDQRGRVLGIATWIVPGEQLGFAPHVSHLLTLKREADEAKAVTPLPRNAPTDHPMFSLDGDVAAVLKQIKRSMEEARVRLKQGGLVAEDSQIPERFVPRLLELADQQPRTRTAFQALFVALELASSANGDGVTQLARVTARLQRHHFDKPGLKYAVFSLASAESDAAREFLETLIQQSPHAQTRAR